MLAIFSQRKHDMLLLVMDESYAWNVLILQSWIPPNVSHFIMIYRNFMKVWG